MLKSLKEASDFMEMMLAAATSKTCATSIAYPHEVVRTRLHEEGTKYRSFFSDTVFGGSRRRLWITLPWFNNSFGETDSKHSYYDGHLELVVYLLNG